MDAKLRALSEQYEHIRDWAEVFDRAKSDEMILARIIEKITASINYEIRIYFYFTPDNFLSALTGNSTANVKIFEAPLPKPKLV